MNNIEQPGNSIVYRVQHNIVHAPVSNHPEQPVEILAVYILYSISSLSSLGNRTIAVCTKLDLMDPGTDALDILYGKGNN